MVDAWAPEKAPQRGGHLPSEPVWKVSSSQSFEHQTRHCHIHKRLTGGW